MDLRHNQLPWSEQIWAKINADLAHALTQTRRVRTPFEVFHVPCSQQTVMADRRDDDFQYDFTETDTTPIFELAVPFEIRQSQVSNEGDNFYSLDRIIAAAHELGVAEDELLISANVGKIAKSTPLGSKYRSPLWPSLYYEDIAGLLDISPIERAYDDTDNPVGLEIFNAVIEARRRLRIKSRFEPFALFLSNDLEGEIQSTIRGARSLNTPIERLKPLVTAGIYTTSTLAPNTAVVVAVARSWVDIAQALEPSIQFLQVAENGVYKMRLVERFAFRLKDRSARCAIRMVKNIESSPSGVPAAGKIAGDSADFIKVIDGWQVSYGNPIDGAKFLDEAKASLGKALEGINTDVGKKAVEISARIARSGVNREDVRSAINTMRIKFEEDIKIAEDGLTGVDAGIQDYLGKYKGWAKLIVGLKAYDKFYVLLYVPSVK